MQVKKMMKLLKEMKTLKNKGPVTEEEAGQFIKNVMSLCNEQERKQIENTISKYARQQNESESVSS